MLIFGRHLHQSQAPLERAPPWALELYALGVRILERTEDMATQDQLNKLLTDIAAMIDAAVAEIASALATAQMVKPPQADAAIDAADARIQATTASLNDASAQLKAAITPPETPPADTGTVPPA